MVLVNTWARSHAKSADRDLLIAYMVIDIRGITVFSYVVISKFSGYHMGVFRQRLRQDCGLTTGCDTMYDCLVYCIKQLGTILLSCTFKFCSKC